MPLDPQSLEGLPLFDSLSTAERESVARWLEPRHADAGERLCGEGASGYSFFVLQSGAADVTRDGEQLATLGPGDFFGELAIVGNGRRTATVTATAPSELLVLFGTEFRRLEQELPEAAERIREAVTARADR